MQTPSEKESMLNEWSVKGIVIVQGCAIGKAFFLNKSDLLISELTLPQEEVEHEIHRYYKALNNTKLDIADLKKQTEEKHGRSEISSILQSHLEIMKDPALTEAVVHKIRRDRKNAEFIFSSVIGELEEKISEESKPVLLDRLQDIQDVSKRVISHLCCQRQNTIGVSDQNVIVFSEELTPTEAASANSSYIKGFVSVTGGQTSHTAIVSRAKGIPYVVSMEEGFWDKAEKYVGQLVILDGYRGEIIFCPSTATLERYYDSKHKVEESLDIPFSVDTKKGGVSVSVQAHLVEDVEVLRYCFPGTTVGLFRSEFLALTSGKIPSIEEQIAVYSKLIKLSSLGVPVIRLFDFGKDKNFLDDDMPSERSIRKLLSEKTILEDQISAIVQTSKYGAIKVLIPFVVDTFEIKAVKELVCKMQECLGIVSNISVGCMIESPSSVMMIEEILEESDFVSIGTNDLTKYVMGSSRESLMPMYLDAPIHPAVIRMIKKVVRMANEKNIPVSVCGEAASNTLLTPFFMGLGVKELVVPMGLVNTLKKNLHQYQTNKSYKAITEKFLLAKNVHEVQVLLKQK